ncbi:MAG: hypothetical protein JJV94_03050 [Sulfurospirillum sp.]|nr:hypothetical protein [Sulfurospirillum sp.]
MKRNLILTIILMLSSTILVANDRQEWFIGGEFGGMDSGKKEINAGKSNDDFFKPTYESIKFGKRDSSGRLYGLYTYQNEKENISSSSLGIGYDYIPKISEKLSPFIGIQIMHTMLEINDSEYESAGIDQLVGVSFGVGGGAIYPINYNTEIELGIRYVFNTLEDSGENNGVSKEIK